MNRKDVNPGIAIKLYRIERWCYEHKLYIIAQIIYHSMQIILSCTIPPMARLGRNCIIPHFHGIVIHHDTIIGDNTTIYQNVTIGGRKGKAGIKVGENCIIGAGAVLLGNISIGANVHIGANSVVLDDIPDDCTVVGVPGKIVRRI